MERHFSQADWDHVFSPQAAAAEAEGAVAHLAGCGPCWDGAARAATGLAMGSFGDARDSILRLLEIQESAARRLLLARTVWAARLKSLDAGQQVKRLKADPALRTREMFDTVLAEASAAAPEDPLLGEEWAGVAHSLAGLLPDSACPRALREDLQGAALLTVANARRLAADWAGSAAALDAARRHFENGTGDLERQARLLSIQASLASDTGQLERALSLLARAAEAGLRAREASVLPSLAVQEASALLAACRYEDAAVRAEGTLALLPPGEPRLELLAWSIAAESFVFLERPTDALRSHAATLPLYEQVTGSSMGLRRSYLEALLLDSFGLHQEAEKAFRINIAKRMDAEHYKDALLTMLTRFEILVRKGLPEKAERVCEEALRLTREAGPGCHGQMIELWQSLLSLLRAGRLAKHHLVEARAYLVRSWHAPAANGPLRQATRPASESPALEALTVPEAPPRRPEETASRPSPESLVACGYKEEMERLERELIVKGLAQCGGKVIATARLLQMAKGTLQAKMKKHGLFGMAEPQALPPLQGASLPQEEQQVLLNGIRARVAWEELAGLTPGRQASRIETATRLRTPEMVGTILAAAGAAAGEDPDLGARHARLAHAVAGMLSRTACPPRRRSDLQAEAMLSVANCLRLAGDFSASADALDAAQRHLAQGTGDAAKQVRLLSVRASLASDTGHADEALELVDRAAALCRQPQSSSMPLISVQRASALLAAFRYEDALTRAEAALRSLPAGEARLELLARSIISESLAHLDRGSEALRSLTASRPDDVPEHLPPEVVDPVLKNLADPLGDADAGMVLRSDEADDTVPAPLVESTVEGSAGGLGGIAAAPPAPRQDPAELEAGPSLGRGVAHHADEVSAGPLLDGPLAPAPELPMADDVGQMPPRPAAIPGRRAEVPHDLRVGIECRVLLEVAATHRPQAQAIGLQCGNCHDVPRSRLMR